MNGRYKCNCVNGEEPTGRDIPTFRNTEADGEGICVQCGFYAVFEPEKEYTYTVFCAFSTKKLGHYTMIRDIVNKYSVSPSGVNSVMELKTTYTNGVVISKGIHEFMPPQQLVKLSGVKVRKVK